MVKSVSKQITVKLSEDQTIVGLSELVQGTDSQVYLKKNNQGNIIEVNLNSFLGLITIRLQNNDSVIVRAEGEDCENVLEKIIDFLS